MRGPSPFGLTVPKRTTETRTLPDPDHPGTEFTFTLGSRNFVAIARAQTCQEELIEKWVRPEDGAPPAFPVTVAEGEAPITVSDVMCQAAASVWAMQAGPEAERYSADEMLALEVTAPRVFEALIAWVGEMAERAAHAQRAPGGPGGNGSGGATERSSSLPSSKDIPTPFSATTSPIAFGASTSALRVLPD
jgi:hypothetical protein